MPLYEYDCGACGHRFEIIQKFSDQPITECPKCRGVLRKLQSAPAFQLKGTGWYATDYPKAGQAPADKDAGSSDSSSGDNAAAKGEKSEKGEKGEKTEKSDKPDKPEKAGKTEKQTERSEKTDKTAPAKDPSSSSSTERSKTTKSET
jgi:putative FmdB family regulatory protein